MPSTFRTAPVALGLARRNWPVLPCHHATAGRCSCGDTDCPSAGKHPRTRHGLHQATADTDTIRRWWSQWPDANIGVRTGAAPEGAGVVVLDIDPDHGGDESLAGLLLEHGDLPLTLQAVTGGGGRHLWFVHPGVTVPNSAGRVGAGIDVRGDGGYVLVSPSRHASGGRYRWIEAPIVAMPAWLLEQCLPAQPPVTERRELPSNVDAWARAALDAETAAVRASVEGVRNHTLNRAAFALGQLAGSGHLDEADVVEQLTAAANAAGLTAREAAATIASGLRAGIATPRHRPVSS
ncbi:MAG TPA: bifunctional DNA primase/polymerase [Acidimicrobiales bacterium]|nr:bifunctional DNA primase/polymerase [Acidimicrobiales bacterium]